SIDLGTGNDTLTMAAGGFSGTVSNVETLSGAAGADTVTLGSGVTTSTATDLGGGSDKLTLAAGGNTGTISNVETLAGGSGADAITLGAAVSNASVDLGSG